MVRHPYSIQRQLQEEKEERKQFRNIDREYIKKAYLYGLLIAALVYFILQLGYEGDQTAMVLLSYALYPFGRIIWDLAIGFWLDYRFNDAPVQVFYTQLKVVIHLLILMFSLFLAPVGLLYLGGHALGRKAKKWGREDGD